MIIGVIGYSAQKFDNAIAKQYLEEALLPYKYENVELVSGLTDTGISSIAYRLADSFGWKTVGIACSKASSYTCYPVDRKQIIGNDWGDESSAFLDQLDLLIRIGGGEQSMKEVQDAKRLGIECIEYELPTLEASQMKLIKSISAPTQYDEELSARKKRIKVKSAANANTRGVLNNTIQAVSAVANVFNTKVSQAAILSRNDFPLKNAVMPVKDAVNLVNAVAKSLGFRAKFVRQNDSAFAIHITNAFGILFLISGNTAESDDKMIQQNSCTLFV